MTLRILISPYHVSQSIWAERGSIQRGLREVLSEALSVLKDIDTTLQPL